MLKVLPSRERVVIEGVNLVFKHMRRTQQSPQGGRLQREGAIHVSNVLLFCEKCGKGRRARFQQDGETFRRACAKCDSELK